MRISLIFLLFTIPLASVYAEDWTTSDGKTYANVKVLAHNASSVTISYEDGGVNLSLSLLSPDLQKRFGYVAATSTIPSSANTTTNVVNIPVPFEDPKTDLTTQQEDTDPWAVVHTYNLNDPKDFQSHCDALLAKFKYDKFNDYCSVESGPVHLSYSLDLSLAAVSPGRSPSRPMEYSFYLISSTDDWNYLDDKDVIFLADGTRLSPKSVDRTGNVYDSGVIENLFFTLSADDSLKLFQAKSLEVKVGQTAYTFTSGQKNFLLSFLTSVKTLPAGEVEKLSAAHSTTP